MGGRASWQEIAPREQRGEWGFLGDGLVTALEPVDDRDRVKHDELREPRALDRLQRGLAGRDDVLEDDDLRARSQPRRFDPLVRAVPLRLLAHDESVARATDVEGVDRGGGRERISAEREPTDGDRVGRDLIDELVE